MIRGHRIEKKVETSTFLDSIKEFTEEQICTTKHTFFRLNEEERKVFKDKLIKEYILAQTPILVGIQYNGNHAVFYKYSKETLKLILDIQSTRVNIVTFYIIDNKQIPILQNEK